MSNRRKVFFAVGAIVALVAWLIDHNDASLAFSIFGCGAENVIGSNMVGHVCWGGASRGAILLVDLAAWGGILLGAVLLLIGFFMKDAPPNELAKS